MLLKGLIPLKRKILSIHIAITTRIGLEYMNIAKVFLGDPGNQKGLFNNVVERTKQLMLVEPNVDCYMIRLEYGLILRLLKRQFLKPIRQEFSTVDGIQFKNLWVTMGLLDYLLVHKLHKRLVFGIKQLNIYVDLFKRYDLLSSHGMVANYLSMQVKSKFQIPFVATWHGSDINVTPFESNLNEVAVSNLLDVANHNFFVSRKLLEVSSALSSKNNKSVLYTGPTKAFYRYSDVQREVMRNKYRIKTNYVVGFIGNFVPIKNILVLPLIFKKIQEELQDISFMVVGDGELGYKLSVELSKLDIKNVYMLGKQEPAQIPDIMNCINILILPSLNEGLPLVTQEALACSVHVLGSNRGGIPESIGEENCFDLDECFSQHVASRALYLLCNDIRPPTLPEKFCWGSAIAQEITVYHGVVSPKVGF